MTTAIQLVIALVSLMGISAALAYTLGRRGGKADALFEAQQRYDNRERHREVALEISREFEFWLDWHAKLLRDEESEVEGNKCIHALPVPVRRDKFAQWMHFLRQQERRP